MEMREKEENEEKERNLAEEAKNLEEERIRRATLEINEILVKYNVQIEGIALIKATEIRIVTK